MISSRAQSRRAAFTLLEVVVAVAIVSLITVSIYTFVGAALSSSRITNDMAIAHGDLAGFNRFVQSQFSNLPVKLPGTAQQVIGKTGRGSGGRSDAVSWIVTPGNAIFARRAEGLFIATLELQPIGRDKKRAGVVLSRSTFEPDRPVASGQFPSVTLLEDVTYFEIGYYDARINNWVDEWKDPSTLPDLVRFRMGTTTGDHEVIGRLPFKTSR